MTKRQTEKVITLQSRTFKIKAFDAMTGSYIAFTLFEKMLPGGAEGKAGIDGLPANRQMMTKQEFFEFQKDCLSVVYEVLKAGDTPVINSNGSWGIEGIKNNAMLAILLTIHALSFNVSDFFGGDGLKELRESLQSLMPSNT